ncbi:MAG: FAD synthetase family protein [Candidatus Protochlamydia sp.]|nr:FAD synthetase family protein [Candidatus Protochlamydia sp.]
MQVFYRLEEFSPQKKPIILTIGNFDGMHRGHLTVLQRTRQLAQNNAQTVLITFSNHPSEVLRPSQPAFLLCSLPHKLQLLEENKIDAVIILPFTRYLAEHSAASFVERLRQFIPFSHLVLGHDATLGRDRQGKPSVMKDLGEVWGFDVLYLDEYRYEGLPVSSTRIRQLLQEGNLEKVSELLGRPYSIFLTPMLGKGVLKFEVKGLCLPPYGTYSVQIKTELGQFQGTAHLREGFMEVELFGEDDLLYELPIEVIF